MWSSVVVTNIDKGKEEGRDLLAIMTNYNLTINIRATLSGIYRVGRGAKNHWIVILRFRRNLFSEYNCRKETKSAEKTLLESFIFSSLFFCTEEKRTWFLNSTDIQKLVADTHPPSDQHAFFCERFSRDLKINGKVIK